MAESRFTSASIYIEIGGQMVRVTNAGHYTEIRAAVGRVTGAGVYVEIAWVQRRVTAVGVYVEIGQPRRLRTRYVYDGIDLSRYCNQADLEMVAAERQKRTLADTAAIYKAGLASSQVRLQGDWNPVIDGILGRDVWSKHWRTGMMEYNDGLRFTRYQWAGRAQVVEWRVSSPANGKQQFEATIRHNGRGERTTGVM